MSNKTLYTTAAASALIAVGVVHFSPSGAQSASNLVVDTTAAIEAAQWSDNVTITLNPQMQTFRYQSDGIPSTFLADAYLVPDDPGMMPFSTNPDATFWTLDAKDIEASPIDAMITT